MGVGVYTNDFNGKGTTLIVKAPHYDYEAYMTEMMKNHGFNTLEELKKAAKSDDNIDYVSEEDFNDDMESGYQLQLSDAMLQFREDIGFKRSASFELDAEISGLFEDDTSLVAIGRREWAGDDIVAIAQSGALAREDETFALDNAISFKEGQDKVNSIISDIKSALIMKLQHHGLDVVERISAWTTQAYPKVVEDKDYKKTYLNLTDSIKTRLNELANREYADYFKPDVVDEPSREAFFADILECANINSADCVIPALKVSDKDVTCVAINASRLRKMRDKDGNPIEFDIKRDIRISDFSQNVQQHIADYSDAIRQCDNVSADDYIALEYNDKTQFIFQEMASFGSRFYAIPVNDFLKASPDDSYDFSALKIIGNGSLVSVHQHEPDSPKM